MWYTAREKVNKVMDGVIIQVTPDDISMHDHTALYTLRTGPFTLDPLWAFYEAFLFIYDRFNISLLSWSETKSMAFPHSPSPALHQL